MGFDDRRLISISARRRFRRLGKVDGEMAAAWQMVLSFAINDGADRFVLEDASSTAPTEGRLAERFEELVSLGFHAQNLSLFSGDTWICGISDQGSAIAALLPQDVMRSMREKLEGRNLLWDEF